MSLVDIQVQQIHKYKYRHISMETVTSQSPPLTKHPIFISAAGNDAHVSPLGFIAILCESAREPLLAPHYLRGMLGHERFCSGCERIKECDRRQREFLGSDILPFHTLQHFHCPLDLQRIVLCTELHDPLLFCLAVQCYTEHTTNLGGAYLTCPRSAIASGSSPSAIFWSVSQHSLACSISPILGRKSEST